MKPVSLAITAAFVLALFVSPAPCQMSRQEKLRKIEYDIAWYESQESKGGWMMLGGVGLGLLSLPALIPNEYGEVNWVALALLNGGGLILYVWGRDVRSNAREYLRLLEVKKYDFSLRPLYLPEQGGALGMRVAGNF